MPSDVLRNDLCGGLLLDKLHFDFARSRRYERPEACFMALALRVQALPDHHLEFLLKFVAPGSVWPIEKFLSPDGCCAVEPCAFGPGESAARVSTCIAVAVALRERDARLLWTPLRSAWAAAVIGAIRRYELL